MNIQRLKEHLNSVNYQDLLQRRFEFLEKSASDPFYRAKKFKEFQENIFEWIDLCVWVYEPRLIGEPDIALIPFPYQVDAIIKLEEAIVAPHDWYFEKSRDMGFSWTLAIWAAYRWQFRKGFSALFGSRKEDEVDNKMVNSLFGKIRYVLSHQPVWLRPKGWKKKMHDNSMKLINPENGSVIEGESSNENFSRGKRNQVIIADEIWFWPYYREAIRAMGDSAPCRIFISTAVEDNFAKRFIENYKKQGWFSSIHWSMNPFKDNEWYQEELKRRASDPSSVNAELEMSYDVATDVRYYPESYACKTESIAYDPRYPVYCGTDFAAFQDYTAIVWYQMIDGKLKCLEAIAAHGRLMNDKILLDWWVPFLNKYVPYDPTWYDEYEISILEKVRGWTKPAYYFGEAAHKQAPMPIGYSIMSYLAKPGNDIILDINDFAIQHNDRKIAVQKYLNNTIFNKDSDGALSVLDSLKSAKKPDISLRPTSDPKRAEKPLHLSGESDLRSAHENMCANIENYIESSQIITGSSYR